jgi:cbb3-type cytochrome oxidase subunit 3
MISGILIALMIALFVGLFVWAWTPGRRQRFGEAAALALVEDVRACTEVPHLQHAEREQSPLFRSASAGSRSAAGRENFP